MTCWDSAKAAQHEIFHRAPTRHGQGLDLKLEYPILANLKLHHQTTTLCQKQLQIINEVCIFSTFSRGHFSLENFGLRRAKMVPYKRPSYTPSWYWSSNRNSLRAPGSNQTRAKFAIWYQNQSKLRFRIGLNLIWNVIIKVYSATLLLPL